MGEQGLVIYSLLVFAVSSVTVCLADLKSPDSRQVVGGPVHTTQIEPTFGSGDCPAKRPISAHPWNWSGAARLALSQTAVAIVYHATRRVAQNQPEQMFV